MKSYEILLIDIDRTLLDFDKAQKICLERVFLANRLNFNEAIYLKYVLSDQKWWEDVEKGILGINTLSDKRFGTILAELGFKVDAKLIYDQYIDLLGKLVFLIDGAQQVCSELNKRKRLFAASNGFYDLQINRLANAGILTLFEEIYVSDRIGHAKPNNQFYQYIFNQLKVNDLSKVLMIGDSLSSDITGGINAGIDTCWVNLENKANNTAIIPTYTIDNLLDLLLII